MATLSHILLGLQGKEADTLVSVDIEYGLQISIFLYFRCPITRRSLPFMRSTSRNGFRYLVTFGRNQSSLAWASALRWLEEPLLFSLTAPARNMLSPSLLPMAGAFRFQVLIHSFHSNFQYTLKPFLGFRHLYTPPCMEVDSCFWRKWK